MFTTLKSKISSSGGITLVHKQFSKAGVAQFINNALGSRGICAVYNYSDIIMSHVYTALCGGSATEDINYIRENTLSLLKGASIPSPDTIEPTKNWSPARLLKQVRTKRTKSISTKR